MNNLSAPRITKNGSLFFPSKPKIENPKAWIGDLFGIPEPSYRPEPDNRAVYRYEMEVLYQDFSTRTYTIEGKDDDPLASNLCIGMQHLAWTDHKALAFSVKGYFKDKKTGKYHISETLSHSSYRINGHTWRWLDSNRDYVIDNPYR